MVNAISKTMKLFFKTTTLHGFKYLHQGCYYDRAAWAACCVASACCAGALCAVVWARFLQVPALLALRDLRALPPQSRMPLLALCPENAFAARQIVTYLSLDPEKNRWLPVVLGKLLHKRHLHEGQLLRLATLLSYHNMSLRDALMDSMPDCGRLVRKCRHQNRMVPCDTLFVKKTTKWGACCLMEPERLATRAGSGGKPDLNDLNERVSFALECSFGVANNETNESKFNSCELMTKYSGEEWSELTMFKANRNYHGQLRLTAVQDPDALDPLGSHCESSPIYSHTHCMIRCRERVCGCADPLRLVEEDDIDALPACSVLKMGCLRDSEDNVKCSCKPSCRKLVSTLTLESTPLNALQHSLGPIYESLDPCTSTLVNIFIRISDARLFERMPTESWLTLLSTLGGVFNMFLGLGLFSALEFLFLLAVRLPLALKRSAELEKPPSTVSLQY